MNMNQTIQKAKNDSNFVIRIIDQYRPLIIKIINRYNKGFDEDLYQECIVAVINAIKRYRSDKNASFFTYLYHTLSNNIKDYIRQKHLIKTPKAIPKSTKEGVDYLSSKDGKLYFDIVYVDKSVDEDEELYMQLPYFEKSYERIETRELVETLLNNTPLTEMQRKVITLRYGLVDGIPKTLREVSKILNISRQRVNQIELTALKKLRKVAVQMGVRYGINT